LPIRVVNVLSLGRYLLARCRENRLKAVEIVKQSAPKLEIWVNVDPCLTRDELLKLKELGVKEVGASFETINREAFAYAKPSDSPEAWLKLAGGSRK